MGKLSRAELARNRDDLGLHDGHGSTEADLALDSERAQRRNEKLAAGDAAATEHPVHDKFVRVWEDESKPVA